MSYRYGIRITHHYYGLVDTTAWVRDPADPSRDLSFATRREALDLINDYDTEIYETAYGEYGECGHPSYRVVRLDGSEPQGFLD